MYIIYIYIDFWYACGQLIGKTFTHVTRALHYGEIVEGNATDKSKKKKNVLNKNNPETEKRFRTSGGGREEDAQVFVCTLKPLPDEWVGTARSRSTSAIIINTLHICIMHYT